MWTEKGNIYGHLFHAVLHVCGSEKILRTKAWKKLRAVGLCMREYVEIVLFYYAGHV